MEMDSHLQRILGKSELLINLQFQQCLNSNPSFHHKYPILSPITEHQQALFSEASDYIIGFKKGQMKRSFIQKEYLFPRNNNFLLKLQMK